MKNILVILMLFTLSPAITARTTIKVSDKIRLIELAPGFYIHESFMATSNGGFTSNGLLFIRNGKALMIDTPMTEDETKCIDHYLKDSMNVKIKQFIGGHYHDDCIGGMAWLKELGVHTLLSLRTARKCKELGLPLPDNTFEQEFSFTFEGVNVCCFFPGGGHTEDNIVVYFPEHQILFGGCLIKSADSRNLGNLADAVPNEWDASIVNVEERFPEAKMIIPGHGQYGDRGLLKHTRQLVNEYLNRQ